MEKQLRALPFDARLPNAAGRRYQSNGLGSAKLAAREFCFSNFAKIVGLPNAIGIDIERCQPLVAVTVGVDQHGVAQVSNPAIELGGVSDDHPFS